MPGFTVTRGLGGSIGPSALIVQGFFPTPVVEAVRGAIITGRRAKDYLGNLLEDLKISTSLIAINGKELVTPIINTVRRSYKDEPTPRISITPTKLVVKQPDIKITAKQLRSKNVNN